jgi:hypothetical protein
VCIAAALLALQLSAGTVQMQAGTLAIVAAHHAGDARHISNRWLNAKRLFASLPVAATRDSLPQVAGNVVPLRAPAAPVRHTGIGPARAPPLS